MRISHQDIRFCINTVQFTAGIILNEKAYEKSFALRNDSIPRNGRNGQLHPRKRDA